MVRQNVGLEMSVKALYGIGGTWGHVPGHVRRHSTWSQDIWDGGEFVLLSDRCTCPRRNLQWAVRYPEGLVPALQRLAPLGREGQKLGRRVAEQQLQRVRRWRTAVAGLLSGAFWRCSERSDKNSGEYWHVTWEALLKSVNCCSFEIYCQGVGWRSDCNIKSGRKSFSYVSFRLIVRQ